MDWNISSLNKTDYNFTVTFGDVPTKVDDFGGRYDDYGYDLSLHDYPEKFEPQPIWLMVIKIIIYVGLILVAIAGNVLVILVVIKNKRMRTTTNFYMVNLAISDLMVTLWCSWVHLVDDFTQGWVLGDFFCKFNSFAQVTSLVSSILSLTLIAFDRFFGIVFAMKAHIIERRARTSLVIVWILSVLVGAPLLHIRQVEKRQWKNHLERWCDGNWTLENFGMTVNKNNTAYPVFYRPARVAYWTFVSLVLFLIPIIAMFAAYFGIIKTLWTAKAPGERLKGEITVQTKMKRKVVVMLISILTIFTVCWFPLQIAILYAEYRPNQTEQLGRWYTGFTFFAKTLAFSNSAINPLIYAGFNDNFRQGIGAMFGCRKKHRWTLARLDSFRSTTVTTKVL